jgi:hypothetical protein
MLRSKLSSFWLLLGCAPTRLSMYSNSYDVCDRVASVRTRWSCLMTWQALFYPTDELISCQNFFLFSCFFSDKLVTYAFAVFGELEFELIVGLCFVYAIVSFVTSFFVHPNFSSSLPEYFFWIHLFINSFSLYFLRIIHGYYRHKDTGTDSFVTEPLNYL